MNSRGLIVPLVLRPLDLDVKMNIIVMYYSIEIYVKLKSFENVLEDTKIVRWMNTTDVVSIDVCYDGCNI